jgi:hypothetical protein
MPLTIPLPPDLEARLAAEKEGKQRGRIYFYRTANGLVN